MIVLHWIDWRNPEDSQGPSAHLEQALALATPARRFLTAAHVELLLLLGNVSQYRSKPLVLDDRRLAHLLPLVEVR